VTYDSSICGRKTQVELDLSHIPDSLLNLIINTVTNDADSKEDAVIAVLKVITHTLISTP